MKKPIKKIIFSIIWFFALKRLERMQPFIIGVGGSVGKTTTKDAVYEVLRVYDGSAIKSEKSYNTDIGVPLAVLQLTTSLSVMVWVWRSLILFLRYIFRIEKRFSSIVLEMGVDKLGDLDFLTSRIKPDIAVMTKIGPEHLELLGSIKNVVQEETKLISCLDKKDIAVLNLDDHFAVQMAKKTKARIVWYGINKKADIWADNIEVRKDGLHFTVRYDKEIIPVGIDSFSYHHIYSILAAFSVGWSLKMDSEKILKGINNFRLPEGRGVVKKGIYDTILIDDSYNASPVSVLASLDTLQNAKILSPYGRRVAFLGDMLEMGGESDRLHSEVAQELPGKLDVLVAVGEKAKIYFDQVSRDKSIKSYYFPNSDDCVKSVMDIIVKKDIVLVKGSRGIRMEKIVQAITG